MKVFYRVLEVCAALVIAVALFGVINSVHAQSGTPGDTFFYHSNSVSVTAASQTVQTTRMRQGRCVSWFFENRSGTETVYLNINSEDGYNGAAIASDVNMVALPPGRIMEFGDSLIKRFSAIGTGTAELYWLCGCK